MIYETEKPETILTDLFGHSIKTKIPLNHSCLNAKTLFTKLNTMKKRISYEDIVIYNHLLSLWFIVLC